MKKMTVDGTHDYTSEYDYVYPEEPHIQKHLEEFCGKKLGFMMHWAPGSQLGLFESWPLADDAASWSRGQVDWTDTETFKEQYWNANLTFNPVKFRPDRLALLAKECGFKYLLFTTKHHDGFCMFDTKTTDYRITHPSCPFHKHAYADIVGSLYEEFRKQDLGISVYFSKPDWHSDDYWHRAFGNPPTRNINYVIAQHPELWESYVSFVHQQITELCSNYGRVDVLWLDGGWVRPDNLSQDLRLDELVERLRRTVQPDLLVCDRTVGGKYENIITPEQTIPREAMSIPWETCIPLGRYFSFHYTDEYKSGHRLVHMLLEIVSKGGSLALNLTPQPDGELPAPAVKSIRQLGEWLLVFGEGIYDTHLQSPFFLNHFAFTRKENRIFAFYLYTEGTTPALPKNLYFPISQKIMRITSMRTGEELPFTQHDGIIILECGTIPMDSALYAEGFCLEV